MKTFVICSNRIKFMEGTFIIKDETVCVACLIKLNYKTSTSISENGRQILELSVFSKDEYLVRIE